MKDKLSRAVALVLFMAIGYVLTAQTNLPEPTILFTKTTDDVKIYAILIITAAIGRGLSKLIDKLIDKI